jgi:hypothetical protein
VLDGWVWRRLLDGVDGTFPASRVARAVLGGLALGFWTPARVGEYAGRAGAFPASDPWTLTLTVFAQRMADLTVGVLAGLAALSTGLATGLLPAPGGWLPAAGVGLGVGGALAALLLRTAGVHWAALALRIHLAPRLPPLVADGLRSLPHRTSFVRRLTRRHRIDVVGGSLVRYLVFTGQFACLGLAFAPDAPIVPLLVAVALAFYAKYLVPALTVLDLGVREAGAVASFSLLGLAPAAGLNAALLLFAINVLLPAVLGLPFVATLLPAGQGADSAASTEFFPILPRR